MFEAIARGEIKALWVMGTNPAVSLPDADAVREALKKLELFVVSENVRSNDTVNAGAACAAAGAGLGREVRHGDQFRTAHLAPARVPAARRAKREPDWWIVSEVAKRLGFGAAFDYKSAGGYVPRARRAVGVRERRQPRFRYRRADRAVGRRLRCLGAGAVAGARRRRRRRQRFFADGGFFTNDRKARFVAPEIPALRSETDRGAAAAAQHRPHPRPVAHHDPHAASARGCGAASAGAVRRDSSRRCDADTASRDDSFARVTTDYGQCILKVVVSDRQQRGMLFAPIHWSEENASRGARRRAGGAVHRSVFRPAREQVDAGVDRALRICLPRLRAVAEAARLPPSCGGRAWRLRAATAICFADNADLTRWPIMAALGVAGDDLAEYRISAAAFIARRRSPATASRPACSSVPRMMPATGRW